MSDKKQRIFRCTDGLYKDIARIAKRENRKIGPQIEHILQEFVQNDKEMNNTNSDGKGKSKARA